MEIFQNVKQVCFQAEQAEAPAEIKKKSFSSAFSVPFYTVLEMEEREQIETAKKVTGLQPKDEKTRGCLQKRQGSSVSPGPGAAPGPGPGSTAGPRRCPRSLRAIRPSEAGTENKPPPEPAHLKETQPQREGTSTTSPALPPRLREAAADLPPAWGGEGAQPGSGSEGTPTPPPTPPPPPFPFPLFTLRTVPLHLAASRHIRWDRGGQGGGSPREGTGQAGPPPPLPTASSSSPRLPSPSQPALPGQRSGSARGPPAHTALPAQPLPGRTAGYGNTIPFPRPEPPRGTHSGAAAAAPGAPDRAANRTEPNQTAAATPAPPALTALRARPARPAAPSSGSGGGAAAGEGSEGLAGSAAAASSSSSSCCRSPPSRRAAPWDAPLPQHGGPCLGEPGSPEGAGLCLRGLGSPSGSPGPAVPEGAEQSLGEPNHACGSRAVPVGARESLRSRAVPCPGGAGLCLRGPGSPSGAELCLTEPGSSSGSRVVPEGSRAVPEGSPAVPEGARKSRGSRANGG
ncbi:basic salivary proline-rich protein 2-like [Pithys albifrons albifrons]|uniref:basic salivary proline-rich protein 2-like n=1 Tax=Pithys albifrons albifrons TaxID=3385563 RepID=UPI003A5D17F4